MEDNKDNKSYSTLQHFKEANFISITEMRKLKFMQLNNLSNSTENKKNKNTNPELSDFKAYGSLHFMHWSTFLD